MAEVKITYETLFDLLRREKSRSELQKLDASFYQDVIAYLKEKKNILLKEEHPSHIFKGEQEKIAIQIKNIQKILRELYELREKKIINLSINKVRTESNLIDTSALLPEEYSLFNEACVLLGKYKKGVLTQVLLMESPTVERLNPPDMNSTSERKEFEYSEPKQEKTIFDTHKKEEQKEAKTSEERIIKVKIMNDLPKFIGQDKKIYGPYSKNDIVELPESLTTVLMKKGRAEEV